MSVGALNGHAATRARVQVGAWGAWWADVDLAEPETLAGVVTLALAGQTLQGTIVAGGVAEGKAAYRMVAGRGGWSRSIAAKGYTNDAGVKVATLLRDLASATGETIDGAPDVRLGPHYARQAGLASAVLHDLAPRAWRVDFDGVTRFGARAATTYAGDGTRTRIDPQGAVVEVATDDLAGLVPGVSVDGAAPATDVEYVLDAKRLTARVYSSPRTSRRLDAMARVLDALDPRRIYRGVYEFRVVQQAGERFHLQPVRAATGLPDLSNVPARGPAGYRADVTPGELVLVAFVDADPSRPVIVAHDSPDAPGWMPLTVELGGPAALGVARMTDAVVAGPFAGTIVGASARIKASL